MGWKVESLWRHGFARYQVLTGGCSIDVRFVPDRRRERIRNQRGKTRMPGRRYDSTLSHGAHARKVRRQPAQRDHAGRTERHAIANNL